MRTTWPTLAETPRADWPTLHVIPPHPMIEGDVERVRCLCGRCVPANEIIDLRNHGLPLQCDACFSLAAYHGTLLHSTYAEAIGMTPELIASHHAAEHESVLRGWHVETDVNRHLKSKPHPLLNP